MSTLVVVFLIPLLWSTAVSVLRRAYRQPSGRPDDISEKWTLAIMLAPVVFGLAVLVFCRLTSMPFALPALPALPALSPHSESAFTSLAAAPAAQPLPLLAWLVPACFVLYASGLVWKSIQLLAAIVKLRRIVSAAKPTTIAGESVHLTEAAIPPIAWGRSTIILPLTLATQLGGQDLRLILAHEQAHLARLDPYYFALLSWVDAIFWFNPFVRNQTHRCRTAAEIACDRSVTQQTPSLREAYAQLLVGTLHMLNATATPLYAPAASTSKRVGDYRERLHAILAADAVRPRRLLVAALTVAVLPITFAQLAYSQNSNPVPTSSTAAVYAVADGRVISVRQEGQTSTPQGMRPNTVVEIDYGDDMKGRYGVGPANSDFKVGNAVTAGQMLSKNGVLLGLDIRLQPAKSGKPACLQASEHGCAWSAEAMTGRDGSYSVAWNNVAFVMPKRTVYADVMIFDEPTSSIFAQGHVRIVTQDNRARLQRDSGTQ